MFSAAHTRVKRVKYNRPSSQFQAGLNVEDLYEDITDGKVLLKLLELITGEFIGRPNKSRLRVQKIENINKSLRFIRQRVSASASNVETGRLLNHHDTKYLCPSHSHRSRVEPSKAGREASALPLTENYA